MKTEKREYLCDEDCNHCILICTPNSRMLTKVLNELNEQFGEGVYTIVQKWCPNLTVCYDCRIDDFCHTDGCKIVDRKIKIVDPNYPVDYSKNETPPTYKCGVCGKTGVKLWRYYQTFLDWQKLFCASCISKDKHINIDDMDANGLHDGYYGKTDQLENLIPAIPTQSNDTFWGYTSTPDAGIDWWRKLANN